MVPPGSAITGLPRIAAPRSVRTEGSAWQLLPPGARFAGKRTHPQADRDRIHSSQAYRRRTDVIGDLFDSPWKILIVAVVLIVLFGSKKLPHAARSLGQSMRILKTEVSSLHEDESVASIPAEAPRTQQSS
jgi:sec-independent protein translocase protein TatA